MHYLLHGQNAVAIDERVAELRAQVDPSGFGSTTLDLSIAGVDTLQAAVRAAPFFGGQRLVVLDKLTGGASHTADDDDEAPRRALCPGVLGADPPQRDHPAAPLVFAAPPQHRGALRRRDHRQYRDVARTLRDRRDQPEP